MKELIKIAGEYLYWSLIQRFAKKNAISADLKKASGNTSVISDYRLRLRNNRAVYQHYGPGAGSKSAYTTVSEAAKVMSIRPLYGNVLYNLASRYKPDTIIELGTAFGISTMYLALGNSASKITTVEGNQQLASIASENFRNYKLNNIQVRNLLFDDAVLTLQQELTDNSLVFIDGNHTYEATTRYYNIFSKASILVFDDIRWSDEMRLAWKKILAGIPAGSAVDLFGMGIIFTKPGSEGCIQEI